MLSILQVAERAGIPWILVGDNPLQIQNRTLVEQPAAWELPEVQKFLEGRDSEIQDLKCLGKGVRLVSPSNMSRPDYSQDCFDDEVDWGLEDT